MTCFYFCLELMGIVAVLVIDPSQEPPRLEEEDLSPVSPEDRMADAKLRYYYPSESTPIEDRRNISSILRGVLEFATFCANGTVAEGSFLKINSSNVFTIMKKVEANILLGIVFDKFESDYTAERLFMKFYETYYLLHGLIGNQANLSDTFEDFIPSFIDTETVVGEASTCTLNGVRYAPIERHGFVAMHAIGCEILAEFEKEISDFFILFSGHLVSMSFTPEMFRPLYNYLVMNGRDGSVDNGKLSVPPYGRIGTPAALPGGGLSSYGRSNKFVNRSGWLLGPTGQGDCVYCPHVYLGGSSEGSPLGVFVLQELLFGFTFKATSITVFKKIEKFLTDNNELNKEILPLVRNDFMLSQSVSAAETDDPIGYVYRNTVNQSGMFSGTRQAKQSPELSSSSAAKKILRSATSLLYPFTATPPLDSSSEKQTVELRDKMQYMMMVRDDVGEIAVKRSTHEGWRVSRRSQSGRDIFYAFKNPRIPLWKALIDIEQFNTSRFNSVYI